MSATATTQPAKRARAARVIIQTSETIVCTNEACQNEAIHRHRTSMNIDRETGAQVIKASCQNCGSMYRITRKPNGGVWGPPKAEIIADEAQKKAFASRIEQAGAIRRSA